MQNNNNNSYKDCNNTFIKNKIDTKELLYNFDKTYQISNNNYLENMFLIKNIYNKEYLKSNKNSFLIECEIFIIDSLYKIYNNLPLQTEYIEIKYKDITVDSSSNVITRFVKIINKIRNLSFKYLNNKLKTIKFTFFYVNVDIELLPNSIKNIEINDKNKNNNSKIKIKNLPNKIEILLINNFYIKIKSKTPNKLMLKNF